ncbi:hypothetical protein BH11VER1_BH11VER1_20900 [soil metagenome]
MPVAALLFSLSSCATTQTTTEVDEEDLFEWDGEDMEGKVSIVISLEEQKAYITIGGEEAGWTYVATGTRGHATPTGKFTVIEKTENKKSNRYGVIYNANGDIVTRDAKSTRDKVPDGGNFEGASMPHWMRLTNYGIGMHEGYIPNPGHPASHGCIRMPKDMAEILFEIVKPGTPVKITGTAP